MADIEAMRPAWEEQRRREANRRKWRERRARGARFAGRDGPRDRVGGARLAHVAAPDVRSARVFAVDGLSSCR